MHGDGDNDGGGGAGGSGGGGGGGGGLTLPDPWEPIVSLCAASPPLPPSFTLPAPPAPPLPPPLPLPRSTSTPAPAPVSVRVPAPGSRSPSPARAPRPSRKQAPVPRSESRRLSERFPDLAAEWHPTLNGAVHPSNVTCGSKHRVWWCCARCAYAWQTSISNRALHGTGCPRCMRMPVRESRQLAVRLPCMARQFHPTRNGPSTPTTVSCLSVLPWWWQCPRCAYEWQATIAERRARKPASTTACPACGQRP